MGALPGLVPALRCRAGFVDTPVFLGCAGAVGSLLCGCLLAFAGNIEKALRKLRDGGLSKISQKQKGSVRGGEEDAERLSKLDLAGWAADYPWLRVSGKDHFGGECKSHHSTNNKTGLAFWRPAPFCIFRYSGCSTAILGPACFFMNALRRFT
ncbi:MAG: hypothetical protein WA821_16340, partial [Anaerolineales bacterium]